MASVISIIRSVESNNELEKEVKKKKSKHTEVSEEYDRKKLENKDFFITAHGV